jgi:hypothetical protein
MQQAAERSGKEPLQLSFLQTLQAVIDAVPHFNWPAHPSSLKQRSDYLLVVIATSEIEYARRPRINPRVVKVNCSKFARKTAAHQGQQRDFEKELSILAPYRKGKALRPHLQAT